MAWTYNANAPGATVKDRVRFEVQDTDKEAPLLEDGEIEYAIEIEAPGLPPAEPEIFGAAARCLEALSRKFAAQADTAIGSLKVDYSKSAKLYIQRSKDLRQRAAGSAAPIAPGISRSSQEAAAQNQNLVQPIFSQWQFTNPWKGSPEGEDLVRPGEEGPI